MSIFLNFQLNSFLPSALTDKPKPTFEAIVDEASDGEEDQEPTMDEPRPKKEKTANESFIFVRPPPSVSNHPLNLQVQLVPPSAKNGERPGSARQSLDLSRAELPETSSQSTDVEDTTLIRTTSNRSEASQYSSYSGSTASFSSYSSSSSSRRMIIPLYNLQAHNVMQNLVVDAGTDAKIAKFMKRGMEIIDLAILEPVEVWGSTTGAIRNPTLLVQATASQISVTPSVASDPKPATPSPPQVIVPAPKKSSNIFGKFFGKKETQAPVASVTLEPPTPIEPPRHSLSTPRPNKRASGLFSGPPLSPSVSNTSATNATQGQQVQETLRPPVLGIQPTFTSVTNPPRGRPTMYVWVVRRWLKGSPTGLGSMMSRLQIGSNTPAPGSGVELRFEWKRSAKKQSTAKPRSRRTSLSLTPAQKKANKRMSTVSVSSTAAGHEPGEESDGGEDSDPEDSETPWTCTLKVKRLARPPPAALHRRSISSTPVLLPSPGLTTPTPENPGPAPAETLKFKLATLSPTPHHPKVVALLKVPFPLPDIEVDNLIARKRIVTPQGVVLPSERPEGEASLEGLMLTAEEIKDVVSSTGLWLIVRENFCGVGKVSRRGDGWRIRA